MVSYIIGLLLIGLCPISQLSTASYSSNSANQLQSIYGQLNNQPYSDESGRNLVVVLDPGHGGKDTGCSGHSHLEKDFTLEFTKELGAAIQRHNPHITVYYTREEDQTVSLNRRIDLANQVKADIFLSIHANAGPNEKVSGFETFVFGESLDAGHQNLTRRENAIHDSHSKEALPMAELILTHMRQDLLLDQSIALAANIDKQVSLVSKYRNRGIKQAQFRVLRNAEMPSVLLEIGYLTSTTDIAKLQSRTFKAQLLNKITNGIVNYLEKVEKA